MTLVHCSGDEASTAREQALGAERDRPSWREARADQADITAAIEDDLNGSGVRREFEGDQEGRAYWWELTHAAARRWAAQNEGGGDG